MALSPKHSSSRLLWLPVELLLIIVDFLCETSVNTPSTEYQYGNTWSLSTLPLHSLSVTSRRLRQLCLARLFYRLELRDTHQLRLLATKCMTDSEFASLIRQIDLAHLEDWEGVRRGYRYGPDILSTLLPCLQSLEWLKLPGAQIDSNLLAIVNSHPTLATVGIDDDGLETLRTLSSSTSLPLSKIRVHHAELNCAFTRGCSELEPVLNRGPRLARVALRDGRNLQNGTLLLPGLEILDLLVQYRQSPALSWLPHFVERHPSLNLIKLSALNRTWSRNPDLKFPSRFLREMEQQSLALTVDLDAFSLSRTPSASSLDDWRVVALQMTITKGAGISSLRVASSIAPHVSSLVVRMSRFAKQPVHIDDVVSSLGLFSSLRRLELHCLNRHLLYEGEAPWILPSPSPGLVSKTSRCIDAHSAVLWIAARIAQATPLELLHLTDEGTDLEVPEHGKRFSHPWSFTATYQIHQNNGLEFKGTQQLNVAGRYSPSAIAASRPVIYGEELCPAISSYT